MAAYGLKLSIPVHKIEYPKNANYLGWLGDKEVETYGYAGPPEQQEDANAAATGLRPFKIPDTHFGVFEGKVREAGGKAVPEGGCSGAVEAMLDKGATGLTGNGLPHKFEERQLYVLADDAAEDAYRDTRLREAEKMWSGCMAEAGYNYATPSDAEGDPRWASTVANDGKAPERGSQAEIEVATADHRCRLDTNYYGKRQAIYAAYQQRIIDNNASMLNSIRSLMQKRLMNARKVAAGAVKSAW